MMRLPFARWRDWPLATQILVWVLCILTLTSAIGAIVFAQITSQTLDEQYQERSLAVASSVAQIPQIVADLQSGDPHHEIRALAAQVKAATRASYVVVTDRNGIRYSHPNPALIGKRLEEPVAVLDGKTHVGIDPGSLGRSANGKAPIFGPGHTVIGEVSVGILETAESADNARDLALIAGYSALVLAVGAIGSLILARRIKRVTFGLEPASIAAMLQEREAMLHGIREGMIGFDARGRITVLNGEARRLLHLEGNVLGRELGEVMSAGRMRDLLTGALPAADGNILTDDALLVVNRMPVSLAGRDVGAVVTLRDRTEAEALIREIRAIGGLSEALRAQEHEYANRLHVIAGLIELGEYDQAYGYLAQISHTPSSVNDDLRSRISPAELAALLTAKAAVAAERGVTLRVTEDSHLEESPVDAQVLLTIVGNLVDNALDAVGEATGERTVTVRVVQTDGVLIEVRDTGPGVPADRVHDVLVDGYSTKQSRTGSRRGLGLALVSRMVRRLGGRITVFAGPGGHFEVDLPPRAGSRPPEISESKAVS
jgi:Signal transduction histidine kinase regulating citrate/malate metabolism